MKCPKCQFEFTGQPASCPSCNQPFAWQTTPETAAAATTTTTDTKTTIEESSNWLDKYAFFVRHVSWIPVLGSIIAFIILNKHKDYKKSLDAHRRLSYKTMQKATYLNTAVWLIIFIGIFITLMSFRSTHA